MRIGFVADVHVGNHRVHGGPVVAGINDRARLVIDTLRRAYRTAAQQGCREFVVLGDLFDHDDPTPQMVREVGAALEGGKPHVSLLLGNHDMRSDAEGDHAFGPLRWIGASVLSAPGQYLPAMAALPFRPGPAEEWLPQAVRALGGGYSVLGFHQGIADETTPHYLRDPLPPDAVRIETVVSLARECHIPVVVAGNWHEYRAWEHPTVRVIQVGALCPTGYANPGVEGYGRLVVVDTDAPVEVTIYEIPGPRFHNLRGDPGKWPSWDRLTKDRRSEVWAHFVRAEVTVADLALVRADLARAKASGVVRDYQVVPIAEEARRATRAAAEAARTGRDLPDAVARYVGRMQLPPGVDAGEVVARARKYLGA